MKNISPIKNKKTYRILVLSRFGTQKNLAEELGVSRCYLSYIINGKRRATKQRKRICRLLNVEYSDLWEDEKPSLICNNPACARIYFSDDMQNLGKGDICRDCQTGRLVSISFNN